MDQQSRVIWKRIPSVPHLEASSNGEIRRVSTKAHLKPYITQGYYHVQIDPKRQSTVHKLVLEAFKGPRPEGKLAAHLNRDKLDNRLSNLAWWTHKQIAANRAESPEYRDALERREERRRAVNAVRERVERQLSMTG
jgi:hypothetical protein